MIRSLIPSLPFSLRYPSRHGRLSRNFSQLSVFPFTQSHHHAPNAVHVAASHLAPFAGRRVPVVAFTFGLLHGFSYTCQPFRYGLISMIVTGNDFAFLLNRAYTFT
jgi:hypothetical protein